MKWGVVMNGIRLSVEQLKDIHKLVHMQIIMCEHEGNEAAVEYWDDISKVMAKDIVEKELKENGGQV